MKSYAVTNQKGGVGKTTLAGNVGHALAEKGYRVILADLDPQASLTTWLLTTAPDYELAQVLWKQANLADAIVTLREGLDLLPTFGLGGQLKKFEPHLNDEPYLLGDLIARLSDRYDFAVLDLSPGWSRLEQSAVLAVQEAISPMQAELFAFDGLEILADNLAKLRHGFRKEVTHRLIIVNGFDARMTRHREITERIQRDYDYRVHVVPTDSQLAKAQQVHKTIFEYDHGARAVEPIRGLASILANGG